ncbi:putative wall-associated receptor kinase-like 16 [Heracleum sosnowskyi]|uniref:Wall-associated receptor kinase-like 16 n=1 Tax=Heracleum sosnowskyi TaxID=360622 RepID=A0AAD8JHV6_9APIA|nr:putative wall-associated receptor kinase-like 16 [Heracleum sosnowskyi]
MAVHDFILKIFIGGFIFSALGVKVTTAHHALPGCQETCGNLSIPYPFGTREGCYLNDLYLISCNNSKPYLRHGDAGVLDISYDGQLRMNSKVAYDCYDKSGNQTLHYQHKLGLLSFSISSKRNKFTAIGCDTNAMIQGSIGQRYMTGCMSLCESLKDVKNGSCSGIGCCQTSIPEGVRDYFINTDSFFSHEGIYAFSRCSYAFVVEEDGYNFSSTDLYKLRKESQFPLVLDWAVGNSSCLEAKTNASSFLCHENTVCYDSDNGPGYLCKCSEGYTGNPYLEDGCEDLDECHDASLNLCTGICINGVGNYTCSCPKGYNGDGKRNGTGCILEKRNQSVTPVLTAGIGAGLVGMLVFLLVSYWGVRQRKSMKLKENFFKQNGGIMLQQLLYKSESIVERAKIYTEEELKKATNNFNESNVIGQGGYGTVYKGVLANTFVAIKKSKVVDRSQIDQFVNEVIILSQIKHPNVVKLLGCCLETPVPLLVYQFVTNDTLFHHIHDEGCASSIPWDMRLRIATETAAALAHMHSAPMHIIHRDVKSANILLDDEYTAKVSDFGVSRLFSLEETHLATLVQGTFGYIDPEYFHSGLLTQKSDVYSFGVVLVELLTGAHVVSFDREEKDRNLGMYFLSAMEDDRLHKILEPRVRKEGHAEQLRGVAELAKKCLRIKGDKRPTMKEVKEELAKLREFEIENYSWVEIGPNVEDREPLIGEVMGFYDNNVVSDLDSMKKQEILQIYSGGR